MLGLLAMATSGASEIWSVLIWPLAVGLLLESLALVIHARYLSKRGDEAAASAQEQSATYGMSYLARNLGLGLNLLMALGLTLYASDSLLLWSLLALMVLSTAIIGRALFYVVVIPTTMPGAFFWRNKGFQSHARESGLAQMPQVGVTPLAQYHDLQLKQAVVDIKQDLSAKGARSEPKHQVPSPA